MDLNDSMAFAFKLAVEEACTNIITHGYVDTNQGLIKLTLIRDLEKVTLTIYDEGRLFDPKSVAEPDINSEWDEREIGGLGLVIIREVMDNVAYEKVDGKGNVLILSKEINNK